MTDSDDKTRIRPETSKRWIARIELENGISFSVEEAMLPLTIGRDSSSDICIASNLVSRQHCELYLERGALCLRDTSTNGTVVDNRLIKRESVVLQGRTPVRLASEKLITITPTITVNFSSEDRPFERRQSDRRQVVRRLDAMPVEVDRRRSGDRRIMDRRTENRDISRW